MDEYVTIGPQTMPTETIYVVRNNDYGPGRSKYSAAFSKHGTLKAARAELARLKLNMDLFGDWYIEKWTTTRRKVGK